MDVPGVLTARDRLPPYDEGAEKGALGSILLGTAKVMDIAVDTFDLQPAAFYVPAHRIIFASMLRLRAQKDDIDILTVARDLDIHDQLEQVGGPVMMDRICDGTPTTAHCEGYMDTVNNDSRFRDIIKECRETEKMCYERKGSVEDTIASHETGLRLIEGKHERKETLWPDIVKKVVLGVEEAITTGTAIGIPTGIGGIDKTIVGLKPTEITVLAARPSMGKSALMMNIAENIASGASGGEERPVGVFSLEMSGEALAMRMICGRGKLDSWRLQKGMVSPSEPAKLTDAAGKVMKLPIFVDDTSALDIAQLRIRARRWRDKFDIELIIVDYLQLMKCKEEARQGRQLELAAVSGGLKDIAKELDIPVLALSQLSREFEKRDKEGRPRISDIRDSGAVEQDADNIWLLRRPCKYHESAEHDDKELAIIDIAKVRNGPTGETRLNFIEKYTRFEDRIEQTQEDLPLGEQPAL